MALPIFGLDGGEVAPHQWRDAAQEIERQGYDSIWVFDAIGRGFPLPDPLMALTMAATVTERVELGTGVLQTAIRNAAEIAHRVLTLARVADGRLLFGVGPGSTADDFAAFGGDYAGRGRRFAEQVPVLEALLTTGKHEGVDLSPWPGVAGRVPLYIGAWRGGWIERAARDHAGWIASAMHNDDTALATTLARFRDAGGRRAIVTNVQLGADLAPAIERVQHLGALGFDDVVVLDLTPSFERMATLRAAL
ncbi:MAG: LLM class flavin-dependent oxidoreductase [Myxococcota bacterium]